MAKHFFTLTVDVKGVSKPELRNYIKEAIECWGGQLHPADPLFNLRGCVKVRHEAKVRKGAVKHAKA